MDGGRIDVNQKDSVISGDIVSNTVINNDPKAMMELFFAFQERFEDKKTIKTEDSDETIRLEIESRMLKSILDNYEKIGCEDIGLYFENSKLYCVSVDPSHVIMLSASSDPENMIISEMKGNTISIDIPMYKKIFSLDTYEKLTLSRKNNLFSVAQNQTFLRCDETIHNSPQIPALQFPMPPLEVKNSDLVKAVVKAGLDPKLDQVFTFHLDVNGDLFIGLPNQGWQHIGKYPITSEFGKLPIQSQYSWNILGPIIENNFNTSSYIQFGQDFPLSFFFSNFGCNFCGFLAPRVTDSTSDDYSDVIEFEYLEWMENTLTSKGYDVNEVRNEYPGGSEEEAKQGGFSLIISYEYLMWMQNTLKTYGFNLAEIRASFENKSKN